MCPYYAYFVKAISWTSYLKIGSAIIEEVCMPSYILGLISAIDHLLIPILQHSKIVSCCSLCPKSKSTFKTLDFPLVGCGELQLATQSPYYAISFFDVFLFLPIIHYCVKKANLSVLMFQTVDAKFNSAQFFSFKFFQGWLYLCCIAVLYVKLICKSVHPILVKKW